MTLEVRVTGRVNVYIHTSNVIQPIVEEQPQQPQPQQHLLLQLQPPQPQPQQPQQQYQTVTLIQPVQNV